MNIEDSMSNADEEVMKHLLSYNQKNNKYSPFAACIVSPDGGIMSYGLGFNPNNPAHHAEIDAINQCAFHYKNVKWNQLTMYTTGEPCIMCSSACCWVNIKRIVYGSDVPFIHKLWQEEANLRCRDIIAASPNKPGLTEHVCQKESDLMFIAYKEAYQNQPSERDNAI